ELLEEERVSEIEIAWGGTKKPEKAEKREQPRKADKSKEDARDEDDPEAGSKASDLEEGPVEEAEPEEEPSTNQGEGSEPAEPEKDDRQRSLFDF
ncbi:MAG: replication factor C large subunit, partial [Methanocrinis sp.]